MPSLPWQRIVRDITSDVDGVKTTFSSWDTCMQKSYCKWPAIVGIIVASLIVLSLLSCLFRCLCCGAECCCGCLSCCNACCPSPRRSRKGGYQQQPQPYYQPPPQPYQQYHSQPAPVYASGGASGYRSGPQTATFDAPSVNKSKGGTVYNEDALPAMPGWDSAQTRHVAEEDVELERLQHPQAAQHQTLLPGRRDNEHYGGGYYGQQHGTTGDLGAMHANPYEDHEYDQHQQYAPSLVESSRSTAYPPTYHSNGYEPQHPQQQSQYQGHAPSVAPSYHTTAFSPVSPVGRRPVQGSWRDV